MFQALFRRILLFLATLFLAAFGLILVHALHETGSLTWKPLTGVATAFFLALLPLWAALARADDYLIPTHGRLFFFTTAAVTMLGSTSLLLYFFFSNSSRIDFFYFGLVPFIFALIYLGLAFIRIQEAYAFPRDYRAETNAFRVAVLPLAIAVPGLGLSAILLVLTAAEMGSDSRTATITEEPPRMQIDAAARQMQAHDLFQLAKNQQRQEHYRRSFELFRQAAEYKHPEADYELALIYSGEGYLRNLPLAYEHFHKAHLAEHLEATFRLGRIYRHGELGIEKDPSKALYYLSLAAEAGHLEAQSQLGHIHNRGEGVEIRPDLAFKWFLAAAQQGDGVAMNDVGIFYLQGVGTTQNVEEGVYWLSKAVDQGIPVAEYNLGLAFYNGVFLPPDYERSFLYFSKLAEKGVPVGFRKVGLQLLRGEGVDQDVKAAFQAFVQGAAKQDPGSLYHLGLCYLEGIGTHSDSAAAVSYLERAALLGNSDAQYRLGRIYLEGKVILRDKAGAATLFRAAASRGLAEAAAALENLEPTLSQQERTDVDERFARFQRGSFP